MVKIAQNSVVDGLKLSVMDDYEFRDPGQNIVQQLLYNDKIYIAKFVSCSSHYKRTVKCLTILSKGRKRANLYSAVCRLKFESKCAFSVFYTFFAVKS